MGWNNNKIICKSNSKEELFEEIFKNDCTDSYLNKEKYAIIDCDGILTDNKSIYGNCHKSYKSYGCYDKEMLKALTKLGWTYFFVSDDRNGFDITTTRLKDLGYVDYLYEYNSEQRAYLTKVLKEDEPDSLVVFIGDSISDILSMKYADYSGTVNNAPDIVKLYCDYISEKNGGEGGLADILFAIHNHNKIL